MLPDGLEPSTYRIKDAQFSAGTASDAQQEGNGSARADATAAREIRPGNRNASVTAREHYRRWVSGRHDALIDHWAARLGLRTGGFKLGVADMLRQAPWCDEPTAEHILEHLNAQRVVPDAWGIRVEGTDDFWCRPVLVIETLEARVTHPTSPDALRWYDQLWWMCDGSDAFELRVFEVSDFDEVRILVGIDAVLGRIQERLPARDRDALPTPTRDGAA